MAWNQDKWLAAVRAKNSLLCVGIDPAESGQRGTDIMPPGQSKQDYALQLIEVVAPFAAAIKLNRNYFKDVSRAEMQAVTARIHALDMIAIDDSKLADIGDTNDAGLFHAAREGFDLVTYAPFPGNVAAACAGARAHGVGLITLVLMSNPEFRVIKEATIAGQKGYEYFAAEAARGDSAGIVIGAPSAHNHITEEEVRRVRELVGERLVLVPGIGAQGGDMAQIVRSFGDLTCVNVGRAVMCAADPGREARAFRDLLNKLR